ncbi:MAG TPA: Na+/H+ antiporter subunit C [Candidatus Binatia bacterium]
MEAVLAFVIGSLYSAGLFMMLRRSAVKLVIGIGLLGHAANLLIFTIAGLTRARPPIVGETGDVFAPVADPLPQALILTAIVIGFAVQAFAVVLIHRVIETVGTDDLDEMKATDT